MMSRSPAFSNKLIMNKYLWMSHQLRHFNDAGSIINCSNAMILVKSLLLEPLPTATTPVNTTLSTVSHQPSHHCLSINFPHMASTSIAPVPLSTHASRSITPPTTICFKPTKTTPLTQSLKSCSNYLPRKTPPLTTYTHCQHVISPTDSLPRCRKRIKLTIPPTVDYHAPIEVPQHISTTPATSPLSYSLRPGTLIWHSRDKTWTNKHTLGSDEYEVLKVPPDWASPYTLRNVDTGKDYDIIFPKEALDFLFPPS